MAVQAALPSGLLSHQGPIKKWTQWSPSYKLLTHLHLACASPRHMDMRIPPPTSCPVFRSKKGTSLAVRDDLVHSLWGKGQG